MSDREQTAEDRFRQEFSVVLNTYFQYLVDGLVEKKIIEPSEDVSQQNIDESPKDTSNYLQVFHNKLNTFRRIIRHAYFNYEFEDSKSSNEIILSKLIEALNKKGLLNAPWIKKMFIKTIIDDEKTYAHDNENLKKAFNDFENEKINLDNHLLALFERFSIYKIQQVFKQVSNQDINNTAKIDYVADHPFIPNSLLLFESKIFLNKFDVSREIILEMRKKLISANEITKTENKIIFVAFVNKASDTFSALKYSFDRLLHELYPDMLLNENERKMYFIPVHIETLHLFKNYLEDFKKTISSYKQINFTFFNQIPLQGHSGLDDHYYSQDLNLIENNYEIVIAPVMPIAHWRVGLKLSVDKRFSPRTNRLGGNCPLFHLERNPDYSGLKVTYYDGTGKHIYTNPTTVTDYHEQPVTIKVSYESNLNSLSIDVLDEVKKSILGSPIQLGGYKWFELFAWGDEKNNFRINATILEVKK